MFIHASTQSKGWKRGSDKKIAEILKVSCDLRDMVGKLHLDALNAADVLLLTAMYNQCFSHSTKKGSIIVKDPDGKVVIEYGLLKDLEEKKAKKSRKKASQK